MGKDRRGDESGLRTPLSPSVPSGIRPLSHQVAGHLKTKSTTAHGFLECDDKTILKPVQPPPKGQREVDFYRDVFASTCTDPELLQLREFLPHFHGIWTSPEGVTYLKLEDVTKQFKKPCIMDIKVGPVTFDPLASAEKQASEKAKYPPLEKVGFQILGFRVYPSLEEDSIFYDRAYGKSLNEEDVIRKGLGKFFGLDKGLRKPAILSTIQQLQSIRQWFHGQRQLSFYASSLLLVYDAAAEYTTPPISGDGNHSHATYFADCPNVSQATDLSHSSTTNIGNGINESNSADSFSSCSVRMIDFTHVFLTVEQDDNYLYGLNRLINYLQQLLKLA